MSHARFLRRICPPTEWLSDSLRPVGLISTNEQSAVVREARNQYVVRESPCGCKHHWHWAVTNVSNTCDRSTNPSCSLRPCNLTLKWNLVNILFCQTVTLRLLVCITDSEVNTNWINKSDKSTDLSDPLRIRKKLQTNWKIWQRQMLSVIKRVTNLPS